MNDLISREEAIDAIYEHEFSNWCDKDEVSTVLNDLPSAKPERKHGKWIKHAKGFWTFVNANGERDGWLPDYECSECGSRGHDMICVYNFCPMCGAEMEMESEWT